MSKKRKLKVAIQGIATSFHEVAAQTYFGDSIESVECLSFHALCESLKKGESDFAVMAIENSIAGSILPNYFLLQEYHFSIIGEVYLPIHMHLLVLPGVTLNDVKCIESHPMAIRQCNDFLFRLKNVEIRESDDTAVSARKVKENKLTNTAAIANEHAAKKFGLQILEKRIETNKKNFTRFLILAKGRQTAHDSNKASLCFEVANEVGSLAEALMTLKNNQINLTKIQSIPIVGKPSEYSIHIDVEWTKRRNYDTAIQEILRQVRNLNVLGEYKRAKIEYK
ncbi:MAG: prephenate dehydratase [Cytophagales bacterium]|jgi:prephenate dehydratase|nr:prephenate dehydratase [Cytophagales bacterium]MCA6387656.1 prephenate dehydratase [Cytophagales bacterium]MCA6392119.1 prephenate dehydratase [Cytophagales bacterium]MCA6393818.1 prephenate dehydratase [Cytophagales bacterium]MCA6399680.1 prephenate dehydratase [Cytophagales bacterium]